MTHSRNVAGIVSLLVASILALVGCGGGGSGGSNGAQPPPADLNLSGRWTLSNAGLTSNCPSTPALEPLVGTVTDTTVAARSPLEPGHAHHHRNGRRTAMKSRDLGNSYGCKSLKASTSDLELDTTDPGKYASATGSFHFNCSFTGGSCSGNGTLTATKD